MDFYIQKITKTTRIILLELQLIAPTTAGTLYFKTTHTSGSVFYQLPGQK